MGFVNCSGEDKPMFSYKAEEFWHIFILGKNMTLFICRLSMA